MLDLAFIFDDAYLALTKHTSGVTVPPLPAAVYMLQVDVINRYRHALTHRFVDSLGPASEKSSLGTPYQKWAYFVNLDFRTLAVSIRDLLRYTSRMAPDTGYYPAQENNPFKGAFGRSSFYYDLLFQIEDDGKFIGLKAHENEYLSIASIRSKPYPYTVTMWGKGTRGNAQECYTWTARRADGSEYEVLTDGEEFDRSRSHMEFELINIGDRSVLTTLRDRGLAEVDDLTRSNRAFADACNAFYGSRKVAEAFSRGYEHPG